MLDELTKADLLGQTRTRLECIRNATSELDLTCTINYMIYEYTPCKSCAYSNHFYGNIYSCNCGTVMSVLRGLK